MLIQPKRLAKLTLLPAALAVLAACGPVHSTGGVAAGSGTAADTAWRHRSAMYEVFVRDFSPAGDFRGVIAGLDRIEATGANIVWLMPIHPVGVVERKGSLGSSYSVRDYRAVNPEYGTLADFRALVDAVHARGMKLIIDWVPNHTSWDNAWISEHPDWYTRNAEGEITEPLNDDGTSTGWTDVADLNYGSADMRRAMIDAMTYWVEELDVDGFRVDVAGFVPDDFWREAVPALRAAGADVLLAEWADPKMHTFGFDLTYGWDGYHALKQVWAGETGAAQFVERELAETVPFGSRLRFTTNHDETAWDEPPVTLFGGSAGARAAFAAIALLPGTPLLYNGQEVESPQQLGLFEKEAIEWERPGAAEARAWYRRIVDLSRHHPAFVSGALGAIATDRPDDVIAYRRGAAIVLVNARPQPATVTVSGIRIAGMRDVIAERVQNDQSVALGAYGVVVLEPAR